MKIKYKMITVILSLIFVVTSMSGCAPINKGNNMCFVLDGNVLKLNNEEIIADNLDCYYEGFAFSNKGNIIYFDKYNEENESDFYLYNPIKKTTSKLNVWSYFDENVLREVNDESAYLSPRYLVFDEVEDLLYFSADTPDYMHYRIFRVALATGKIDYSPELHGSTRRFAVNQDGTVLYSREENECVNIYSYNFESSREELYVDNARDVLSSIDGKYLFYDADEAYVVFDTETSKEYVLDKKNFYIEQPSFSFLGNSLISAEYHYNPWSLFSATTIDVRQIDFKTGKSKIIFEIK